MTLCKPGSCCPYEELVLHQCGGAGDACAATPATAFLCHAEAHLQAGICDRESFGSQGQLSGGEVPHVARAPNRHQEVMQQLLGGFRTQLRCIRTSCVPRVSVWEEGMVPCCAGARCSSRPSSRSAALPYAL